MRGYHLWTQIYSSHKNGKKIKVIRSEYGNDGKVSGRTEEEYDSHGNTIKSVTYNEKGQMVVRYTYVYTYKTL